MALASYPIPLNALKYISRPELLGFHVWRPPNAPLVATQPSSWWDSVGRFLSVANDGGRMGDKAKIPETHLHIHSGLAAHFPLATSGLVEVAAGLENYLNV